MYLDALLDFYCHKSSEETLRVDEQAELDSHGLSLDQWQISSDEQQGEIIYGRKNSLYNTSG
jgi:hypothetical protein